VGGRSFRALQKEKEKKREKQWQRSSKKKKKGMLGLGPEIKELEKGAKKTRSPGRQSQNKPSMRTFRWS